MEGNASDDEVVEEVNTKTAGKKQKLNDGSSQDTVPEEGTSKEPDENVDSGVCADKSESTSSEAGPSNEVVNAAPSSSNIQAILLNFTRPRWSRNYRKRKTSDHDSDSDSSERDSDDVSPEDSTPDPIGDEDSSDDNLEPDFRGFSHRLSELTDSEDSLTHTVDLSNNEEELSNDDIFATNSEDSDSDEETAWYREEASSDKMPRVLTKTRPKHNYILLREILNREMGLTFPSGKTIKEDVIFEQKYYGSLHVVYRLKRLHQLRKHGGCVNSINFHPEGQLLASGSDDLNVIVWDWYRKQALQTIKSGHKSNVFQSKFMYLNARSQLNIVTCARDGQVRLLQCPPSGGGWARRRLCAHSRAAHKLHVSGAEPHCVLSAGEDGRVLRCDVRHDTHCSLVQVRDEGVVVPLYSIHGHPLDPNYMLIAGRDRFVRVYDRRKMDNPAAMYSPSTILKNNSSRRRLSIVHLTCAVYNHDGSEILGSYNDDDIYLFDCKNDVYDSESPKEGYTHKYEGHKNSATFKGVAFFGPKSQYVVSGSDCSYIYIWDKHTESIVQWMKGDGSGVVNCLETHPRSPVLATSGLDRDVKIWVPASRYDPKYKGLARVVRSNSESHLRRPFLNDFLPTVYSAWRGEGRFTDDEGPPFGGNLEFDGNVCTAF